jgi:ABC-type multidrug transport system ATPase subunit
VERVLARPLDVVKESGGAMHIRHVSVENVRRFGSGAGGVDLDLAPRGWIVIAGLNGAGKTTLLKAIAHALSPALTDDFANTLFSWVHTGAITARTRLTLVPRLAPPWPPGSPTQTRTDAP